MRELLAISYLKADRVLKFAFSGALLLLLSQMILIIINYRGLPPLIPLYFHRPWGTEQIANVNFIFLIPAITLVLVVLNTNLALIYYKESVLISRILVWTELLFCFLSTVSVFKIILLTTT